MLFVKYSKLLYVKDQKLLFVNFNRGNDCPKHYIFLYTKYLLKFLHQKSEHGRRGRRNASFPKSVVFKPLTLAFLTHTPPLRKHF